MLKNSQNRLRTIVGNIMIAVPTIAVLISESMKFFHVPAVVDQMAAAGFQGDKLILVATLGVASTALFLYPRSRSIGVLLLSAFLGGAICVHVQQGKYATALAPAFLLVLAWTGLFLRHPEVFWRFEGGDFVSTRRIQQDLASAEPQ